MLMSFKERGPAGPLFLLAVCGFDEFGFELLECSLVKLVYLDDLGRLPGLLRSLCAGYLHHDRVRYRVAFVVC